MGSQRHRQPHPSQTHKPQPTCSGKKLKLTLVWPHHQFAPCWSNLTLGKGKPRTRQRKSLRGLKLKHRIGSELIASVTPDTETNFPQTSPNVLRLGTCSKANWSLEARYHKMLFGGNETKMGERPNQHARREKKKPTCDLGKNH